MHSLNFWQSGQDMTSNAPRERMLGAHDVFSSDASFLRGLRPSVLRPGKQHTLSLPLGVIGGPRGVALRELGQFNPSLVRAPPGLCPHCKFVMTIRVDQLHQCNASSPLYLPKRKRGADHFIATAVAVLDFKYRVLGRTWLMNAPKDQLSKANDRRMSDHWVVADGSSGAFAPTWSKPVFDVRLFEWDGHLLATSVCPHYRCRFAVAHVQITGEVTADGGVSSLRAWQSEKLVSGAEWARGRNQALFQAQRTPSGPLELMVQPWPGLVASFGQLEWSSVRFACRSRLRSNDKRGGIEAGDRRACGPTPSGTRVTLPVLERAGDVTRAESTEANAFLVNLPLLHNETAAWSALGARGDEAVPETKFASTSKKRRFSQLSSTAHLVRIGRPRGLKTRSLLPGAPPVSCDALLGVAHLHRTGLCARHDFAWGSCYTHAFYLLEPRPPFGVVATSSEFCIASTEDASDCESVQFVSSLTVDDLSLEGDTLLLAYGANDCAAKIAEISLQRVWEMLTPLPGVDAARLGEGCFPNVTRVS